MGPLVFGVLWYVGSFGPTGPTQAFDRKSNRADACPNLRNLESPTLPEITIDFC